MKFKDNKPFWVGIIIGIIVIGGIAIFPIIIELSKPIEPKLIYYFAIDDVSMRWNQPDGFNGSETFIVSGSYKSSFYSAWIQFDLTDRPNNWKSVEISLYNFESDGEYNFKGIDSDLYGYIQDWNDTMTHEEFKSIISWIDEPYYYWSETDLGYNIRLTNELGLQRINITNPIKDYFDKGYNGFVSLLLSGMYGDSGYVRVYSREADVNKTWLPQLIWS